MSSPIRSLRLLPKSKAELDRLTGNRGEIFYDSTSKTIRVFDGLITGGTLLNASVTVSDNPPVYPTNGSLWFNSSNAGIYIYYADGTSNQWIQPVVPAGVSGSGGSGGSGTSYILPAATTSILGGVKVDGNTITINGSGVITSSQYTLPTASTSTLGGVKVDGTTITITGGIISAVGGSGGGGVASDSFKTISVSGQNDVVADGSSDILTLVAGSGISITTNATADSITFTNNAAVTNSFSTIEVATQSTLTADSATSTLEFVAGQNVTITTDTDNNLITINAGYDQELNTNSNVTFNTVSATQLLSSGVGIPTYTSATDFIFNTGSSAGELVVNGSIEATKVLRLVPQASAPTALSGSLAVANGTTWDPGTKGSGPYPVFYTGTVWVALY